MRIMSLVALTVLTASAFAADDAATKLFNQTKVWEFHLTVPAKEYEAMQPAPGGFFGGPPGGRPGMPPAKPPEKTDGPPREVHKGGSFGIEFPVAHAAFAAEDKVFKDVGLRYKGGGSYMMAGNKVKRNFKVELDHFNADEKYRGQRKLNLNAGAADATRLREALAFAAYREAGVPAPRTSFAEVTLTVPGKYDKELLGLYTVIEQVDKNFLKNNFKDATGLLLKPEIKLGNMRGLLTYVGDDWEQYKDFFKPKREPTKAEAQRIIECIKLIDKGDDERFRKEIGNYVEVDAFLRYLAVTALLVNLDSFFTGGHNSYVYLNPETNKFVFIPWDLDLAFGGFFMLGSPDQQAETSLTHPYSGEHKLVDRMLAIKDVKEKYQKLLKELSAGSFSKERLLVNLDAIEKATKEPLARETKVVAARKEMGFGFGPPGTAGLPDLRSWVDKRSKAVEAQLAGKTTGTIPAGFGPPPGGGPRPGGPPPRPGELLPQPLQDALRLTDEQKRKFAELQKEVDAKVEKLLTEDQKALFKRIREGGPPGGPGKERPKGDRP
jgi:spore coat protein H